MHLAHILQYRPKENFFYRIDSRVKLLWLLVSSVGIFLAGPLESILLVILLLILLTFSKVDVIKTLKALKGIILFLFIAGIGNAVFTPGEVVFWVGNVSITREGLEAGLLIVARLIFLFLASAFLSLTTSPLQLSEAVEWYLSPLSRLGVNTGEVAFVISLALRSIPMLAKEAAELRKSQEALGIRLRGGVRERLHALYLMLVPLIFLAFRRSEEMALAMEARAYHSGRKRIKLHKKSIDFADLVFLLITGAVFFSVFLF